MSLSGPLARGRKPRRRLRLDWRAVLLGAAPYDFYGPGLPTTPTRALPGTADKVEVLAARYARREQLFHPGDARLPAAAAFRGGGDSRGDLIYEQREVS